MSVINEGVRNFLINAGYAQKSWSLDAESLWTDAAQKAFDDGKLTDEKLADLQKTKVKAADLFGGARVKTAGERYDNTKSVAKHVRTGEAVRDDQGREVQTISQREHAKAGAFLKRLAQRSGLPCELNEHEQHLLAECYDDVWCGKVGGEFKTGIEGMRVKTLLDDATSGGQELVPEFFDTNVIQYPLLHSELLPKIDLVNVSRGSSVETAAIGNPTVTWGTAEGTGLTAFTTTSLVSGIDTDIHPFAVAIEIGRDFLSDAAVDIGRVLTENVGQRLLSELDRVIVSGAGGTEPAGIFGTSGMTDIGAPAGGNGAAPQVNDYEALMFAVGKQYRNPTMRCSFIANDVTYRRAQSIPTGGADATRVFGMRYSSYELMGNPFCVQNGLANTYAAFGALAKYRLYRRQAQEVRFETAGKTLTLANTVLLNVRGRYGGKVVDANAFAFSDNWQA
jgi:HK97 family phage major capsid protein